MEMRAYPSDYLIMAQRIMGDMLDFAVNTCDMDLEKFYGLFLMSDVSTQFQTGNPTYIAGKTGCELAKEVDFFSVGTNDLTQYTLAIDRQNQKLDAFYDPHHPAVLAMIRMAAENAHAEGKWIGICGELGADLELTEEFLSMGLDELSVSPAMVLPLRKKIRETK